MRTNKRKHRPFNETRSIFTLSSSRMSVATVRISSQSLTMSSFVVWLDVTVNRMTYLPFSEAGTQCRLPRLLSRFNRCSVKELSPFRRNTTMPKCLLAGISKRLSLNTNASNFCANRTPSRMCACRLTEERGGSERKRSSFKLLSIPLTHSYTKLKQILVVLFKCLDLNRYSKFLIHKNSSPMPKVLHILTKRIPIFTLFHEQLA